jgi:serine/threonine protein kinase/tetratricopeptide (TPR) repeat protein
MPPDERPPRDEDETMGLPPEPADGETVGMPTRPKPDDGDRTVGMPPRPAPADGETVAMPPSEEPPQPPTGDGPTIALPPSRHMPPPSAPRADPRAHRAAPLPQVENYRVLEVLGEGGVGIVYVAEQLKPVRRRVALKVVKAGMSTEEVVGRFEAERQALAMMDHPNIAKVFDAGVTVDGSPFFAMEYVPGLPINDYCDRHNLPVRERLELFARLCDAVQHAHQKGIIHRDIKPTNLLVELVDNEPMPKVIDFGVAKATAQNLTDREFYTELGRLIGTPEYMSPEQAEMTGLNIDTRTDIYSLGAVLYELLAGALPFDSRRLREAGLVGIQNILRHEEPKKPSARLADLDAADAAAVAKHRGTTSSKLGGLVRGDLDWIVMRALEKDRTRRYASASELAADIRRHLNDEPVAAGPPGLAYRLRKFRRRYRTLTTVVGIAVLLVTGSAIVAFWQWGRASRAEKRAVAEAAIAKEVNLFLNDMLAEASPDENPDREITLRQVLDDAAGRIGESFGDQPAVRAAVQNTIGMTYLGLGLYDDAEPHLRSALETRESLAAGKGTAGGEGAASLGTGANIAVEIAQSRLNLGRLLHDESDDEGAERLMSEALESFRGLQDEYPEGVVDCLIDLAVVQQSRGDYEEAEANLREALELGRTVYGEESGQVANTLHNLAWMRQNRGDLVEAEKLYREALVLNQKSQGPDHPNVLGHELNLAGVLQQLGKYEDADSLYEDAIGRLQHVLGPEHPTTLIGILRLAEMHLELNHADRAQPLLEDALAVAERTLGPDHMLTVTLLADLGWAYRVRGNLEEAEKYYRETLARRSRTLGDDHPYTIRVRWQVGRLLVDQGKYAEAESFERAALEAGRRVLPAENENVACTLGFLGLALVGQGKCEEAEPLLRECLTSREANLPEGRWEIAHARSALGACLAGQGRFVEAESLLANAHAAMQENPSTPSIRLEKSLERLVSLYERWNAADPLAGESHELNRWRDELRVFREEH